MGHQDLLAGLQELAHRIKPLSHEFARGRKAFGTEKFVRREENHLVFVEEVQKEFISLLG